jgi:Lon protease-like protein
MVARGIPRSVRLPIFPLHAVLFPGATLALHIFEPRYREMVGRCLAHDETFGIALIEEGEEAGPASPRPVGTEAAIIASRRHTDGRYDIVAEGRRRFEMTELDRSRNLLVAEVRFLDEPAGREAADLAQAVGALFEGVAEAMELAGQAVVDDSWKELDPVGLSYRVAAALPGAEPLKQELLEAPDADARLRKEAELLMSIRRIGAAAGAA